MPEGTFSIFEFFEIGDDAAQAAKNWAVVGTRNVEKHLPQLQLPYSIPNSNSLHFGKDQHRCWNGCFRRFIVIRIMLGLTLFAAVASLSLSSSSSAPNSEVVQPDNESRKLLPRNDSEFSLGLNRSESVANGLIQ